MKISLFFLFLSLNCFALSTNQSGLSADSTSIEIRNFEASKVEVYKSNPIFDYDRPVFSSISFIDIVLAWLWNNFFKYLLQPGTATFWEILIYIFAFATIIYLVRQFAKNKLGNLFYNPESNRINISTLSADDIHDTDLNSLLEKEIKNKNFRKAVRLLYLITLKILSDKNFIAWRKGKTNHEYCTEIKRDLLKEPFLNLTLLYENIWYGDFKISETGFKSISDYFNSFKNKCGQEK